MKKEMLEVTLDKFLNGYNFAKKKNIQSEREKVNLTDNRKFTQITFPIKKETKRKREQVKPLTSKDESFIMAEFSSYRPMKYLDFHSKKWSVNVKEDFKVSCTYCLGAYECEIINRLEELLQRYHRKSEVFLKKWVLLKLNQLKCNKKRYFIFRRYGTCFDSDLFESFSNRNSKKEDSSGQYIDYSLYGLKVDVDGKVYDEDNYER